jgi:hypothetical protein
MATNVRGIHPIQHLIASEPQLQRAPNVLNIAIPHIPPAIVLQVSEDSCTISSLPTNTIPPTPTATKRVASHLELPTGAGNVPHALVRTVAPDPIL